MEITTTLLEYGASTNTVTRQGITPLHLAAQEGNVDIVTLLLARDAPINMGNKVPDLHEQDMYVCLCVYMYVCVVQTCGLLAFLYMILVIYQKAVHFLLWVCRLLFSYSYNAQFCGFISPFYPSLCIFIYICTSSPSLVLTLSLNVTVCPQSGLTPLHLAAQEDKVNVAEVLVNQGATLDPETKVMIQVFSHPHCAFQMGGKIDG